MSDDLKTLVAQEVAKQLAAIAADQTTKKVLEFLKNRNSALAYVVDKGEEGGIRWRLWSDGLIEQWIIQDEDVPSSLTANKNYTFPKAYSNDRYTLIGIGFVITGVGAQYAIKTTTGFTTCSDVKTCGTGGWYAIGY